MVANEWNPSEVFEVLADERARAVLIATHNQKHSVKDLDRLLDASQSSIYRRVDVMVEFGLLEEQTKIDEEGRHKKRLFQDPQPQPSPSPGLSCTRCGNTVDQGTKFCPECGKNLA